MGLGYDHEVEHFEQANSQSVNSQEISGAYFTYREFREGRLETNLIIDRLRVALGEPTNAALAQRLGVGASAISNWITRNAPPFHILADVAEREGLSLDWLVFASGDEHRDAVVPKYATPQGARLAAFILSWEQEKPAEEMVWLEQQVKRAVPEYIAWLDQMQASPL